MLQSLLGIRLVFLAGSTVPVPPPLDVTLALARVEVTNSAERGDGFQLTFLCARSAIGDYPLVRSNTLAPMTRVVLAVIFGVVPQVLIDGVVTHAQFDPGSANGTATLTITGRDVTTAMDLEEKNENYPNQTDAIIVARLLAGYAQYGIVPVTTPTTDVPIMLERIPRQHETDLHFIQRMAKRNGYVFYVEPVTIGVNRAHFGPENRLGLPQSALSLNLGAASNVKSLHFSNDALAATGTKGVFLEPITRTNIPLPVLPSLKLPPLSSGGSRPLRTRLERETGNRNAASAAVAAVAAATNTPDPVRAEGELDGVRYGTALRARRLVGVRGAGFAHDGFWYVQSVTHTIARGSYAQRFSLSRDGVGTATPVVIP